jgi:hypothetical protein
MRLIAAIVVLSSAVVEPRGTAVDIPPDSNEEIRLARGFQDATVFDKGGTKTTTTDMAKSRYRDEYKYGERRMEDAGGSSFSSVSPTSNSFPTVRPSASPVFQPIGNPILTGPSDLEQVGLPLALSSNGRIVAVAQKDAVHVYRLSNDFTLWAPLGPSIPGPPIVSIALASDALIVAIGDPSFQNDTGRVSVYSYNAESLQWKKLGGGRRFIGNRTGDRFGHQVALSKDGRTLAVAASNYDTGDASYAMIWSRSSSSGSSNTTAVEGWTLLGRVPGLATPAALSIAVVGGRGTSPGPRLALGDPNDGIVGKVIVYECTVDEGCVTLGQEMSGVDYEDYMGSDLSFSEDGSVLAIASPGSIECFVPNCANVRIMEYQRGSEDVWSQVGQELSDLHGIAVPDYVNFGYRVRLSGDGKTVAVGLVHHNESLPDAQGEDWTQVYTFSNGIWESLGDAVKAPLLDMSRDATTLATGGANGAVVIQSYDVVAAAPTSSPSVSPNASPVFQPIGDPIPTAPTDWGQVRPPSALSSNGRIVAVAQKDAVQVYRLTDDHTAWAPLGHSIPGPPSNIVSIALASNVLVLAIGDPSFQNDTGVVIVYSYSAGSLKWKKSGGGHFTGNRTGDRFGHQVALSKDGNTLAVAASNYDIADASYAVIWSRSSSNSTAVDEWTLLGRVPGLAKYAYLSIALAGGLGTFQNIRLALGDINDGMVGRVAVYECTGVKCEQLGQTMYGADYEDLMGYDVSLSDDGNLLAIGSPGILECGATICANVRVMAFALRSEAIWSQVGQELTGSIGFGQCVRLSGDGNTVAIGFTHYKEVPLCAQEDYWTQVYTFSDGIWQSLAQPVKSPLLDMSRDATTLATGGSNGTVVTLKYGG